jgi:hypothetical protein
VGSMKRNRRPGPPVTMLSGFIGFRFPPEVILLAVRWYLRYGLSYRDLEELLAERGIEVDHDTVYGWVQRFTPLLIDAARPRQHLGGDRWFVDETYVKVCGVWSYVYRAVDQRGQVIDVYVSFLVQRPSSPPSTTELIKKYLPPLDRPCASSPTSQPATTTSTWPRSPATERSPPTHPTSWSTPPPT